ncbi:efflux RND transporter periplasmic adaptor subunit [Fimbriimonas ginsengisoli]|uniref:Secretion protein HlyD family protein n=1 Tax=Fimbriimonas ginsengisoli Gsoil 348 TaxID=661478 RepID=A0A068NK06_FIMGI|nr:efflux RND transporter periplasmic adaptor subunit [Fimbriimonas ginsengisoli]AIE83792.1 secretion protein HlyD family protein [Fimbriimonas ginsengisoli Gsoil 348]
MTTVRWVFLVFVFLLPAMALSLTGRAGPYTVEITTDPNVLPVGKATLDMFVTDASGKPVEGAQIRAIAQMPNMAMGEREQVAAPSGTPGHYRITQSFSMAGGYEARIAVTGPLGSGTAVIPMETGKSTATAADGGRSVFTLWPWAVGLALVLFVVLRMRQTGQRVELKGLATRQVVAALVVLGLVLYGALYAVNHLRRSGSMTPIEAQTMSMDMPPPEGVTPVTLATAELRPFSATVKYSGQAVGMEEQDVNARTSGVIVWMPAYAGTAVHRGEVIARLDTSQLAPQVAQQSAMVESAREGVGVAEADYRQAQAMIHQAESELGQFQGAVEETRANLAATRQERDAAAANLTAARADVADAQARQSSAQADRRYWSQELDRESKLFAAGAVSRDEYDKERAEASKSDAALRQATEGVRSAEAKVRAAEAELRKSEAGIEAASRKVDQAKSALMAHHAHVQTAKAEAASAHKKIGQAAAGVRQARAGLQGVTAQAGYAEIRAAIDGVVTQRLISPGTLVTPGQAILRVAQISPVRVQANVPEADLTRVRIGSLVAIRHRGGSERPLATRVTSISPAVDPVSRTGIVEALLPNRDRSFLPGQFVNMEIPVGLPGSQITVPTAAIQAGPSPGGAIQASRTDTYVWLARPVAGQAGTYTVERRSVVVGEEQAGQTAIRSGLAVADKVVVEGAAGLSSGQTVTASGMGGPDVATKTLEISITESGFDPASLTLTGPTPHRVTFVRKTDNTCAKQVVFPSLGITRDLPLNVPVTIDLPATAKGELNYACGMNMLKGKVIVQ